MYFLLVPKMLILPRTCHTQVITVDSNLSSCTCMLMVFTRLFRVYSLDNVPLPYYEKFPISHQRSMRLLRKNELKTLTIFLIHLSITSAILTENAQAYLPIDAASTCSPNSLYQAHLVKLMLPSKRTLLMSPVTFTSLDGMVFSQLDCSVAVGGYCKVSLYMEKHSYFTPGSWHFATEAERGRGDVTLFSSQPFLLLLFTLIYSLFLSPNL